MRTDIQLTGMPDRGGGANPGSSAWGSTTVGEPRAATAGDHPDPRTMATSCSRDPGALADDLRRPPREFGGIGQGFGHSRRA